MRATAGTWYRVSAQPDRKRLVVTHYHLIFRYVLLLAVAADVAQAILETAVVNHDMW